MGTTLTGTTPQDTYDSLIKVTDNAPLTGSLKVLTDGLGNDSALALSTGAASVTGTLAVSQLATLTASALSLRVGNATGNSGANILIAGASTTKNWSLGVQQNVGGGLEFTPTVTNGATTLGTTPAMVILDAGNVGIGTSAPSAELQVNKASDVTLALSNSTAVTSGNRGSLSFYNSDVSTVALIKATAVTDNVGTQLEFYTRPAAGSLAQTMTITSTGNVGIGTSAPTGTYGKLTVAGGITINPDTSAKLEIGRYGAGAPNSYIKLGSTSGSLRITNAADIYDIVVIENNTTGEKLRVLEGGGITFNGDTAASNALDDYEEGTWTMGVAFGGAAVGVTYTSNTGTYTKIGRQVTVNGWIVMTSKGSSTGTAAITGLPFAIGSASSNYAPASFRLGFMTYTGMVQGYGGVGGTTIPLEDYTEAGSVGDITDADFSNGTNIMVSFTYFV